MRGPESIPGSWRSVHKIGATKGGIVTSEEIVFNNPGQKTVYILGDRPRRYIVGEDGKLQPLDDEHELFVKKQEIENKTS